MLDGSKEQFQLGLLYLFAGLATFGVLPFCVMRLLQAEYLKAFFDFVIVVAAIANAFYAWRIRSIEIPCLIAAASYSISVIAIIYLNSALYVVWLFPARSEERRVGTECDARW